MNVTFPCI